MTSSRSTEVDVEPPVDDPSSPARPEPTELLIKRLRDRFEVRRLHEDEQLRSYLDTSDRRLAGAELLLYVDQAGHRLVLERAGAASIEQTAPGVTWPARLDAVPDGPVRRALTRAVGIRALLPYAQVSVGTTSYGVLNRDGKTVLRLRRSRGRLDDRPLPDLIEIERLRGYESEATWVAKRLRLEAPAATGGQWAAALRAVPVPGQPPATRTPMTVGEPAPVAVAGFLLDTLTELEATLDGIRRDLDIEYLHDFRVAVRRTRSVLKLLGDVLPAGMADRAQAEFRWLGQVSTPGRDLDVYVAELPELASELARPRDLDAFAAHVAAKRATAYAALRRVLRSDRFLRLCRDWRTELEAVLDGSPPDGPTAGQLADQRLHRTFRKVAARAKAITPASESEAIHDLRKACKELRYLLEMFKPLCDPRAHRAVIGDFKGLQDVLGEFQDGEVQAAALREFAEEMLTGPNPSAATLLAMGELAAQFDERQAAARSKLIDQHMTHLSRSVARHVDHVVAIGKAR